MLLWLERLDADPRPGQAQRAASGQKPQPVVVAHVRNDSEQLVYRINYSWSLGIGPLADSTARTLCCRTVMTVMSARFPTARPSESVTAVLYFTDAAGPKWRRHSDGKLDLMDSAQ